MRVPQYIGGHRPNNAVPVLIGGACRCVRAREGVTREERGIVPRLVIKEEVVHFPEDADFQDTYLPGERRPYRALDYALFAQDAFERWIGDMTRARGALTVAGADADSSDAGGWLALYAGDIKTARQLATRAKTKLPVGLQIIGNHFDEETVLRVAYAYEQATDWHTKCPSLP